MANHQITGKSTRDIPVAALAPGRLNQLFMTGIHGKIMISLNGKQLDWIEQRTIGLNKYIKRIGYNEINNDLIE